MSNTWSAGIPFPSGTPGDGSGIVTGNHTSFPLTWSMKDITKIEWMWKKLVATLTAGSFVFDGTDYPIGTLGGNATNTTAANWRELVPGPGFPPARSWSFGASKEVIVEVDGLFLPAECAVQVDFSGLLMLPGGTHTCIKTLQLAVSVALSVGEAGYGVSGNTFTPGTTAGSWSAFGESVTWVDLTIPGRMAWGTPPALTVTAPEPFLPAPGAIG